MLIALRPTQDTIDIVASLGGKWHGSYALCRCPAHTDSTPSLSIRQGNKGLLIHCFAGCDPEDILRQLGRIDVRSGTPKPPFTPARSSSVRRIWEDGREIAGTLAERYLVRRNLPADLPDIRFHPRCPLGSKPHTQFLPALLVALRQGWEVTAVQRILLNTMTCWHDGKYMLGRPHMASWQQCLQGPTLAIAEGFEDAAAFTKLHGIACWASLGAERLPLMALPDSLETLIIAEDNDPPGRSCARRAWNAYKRPGLRIIRRTSSPHKDWAAANEVGSLPTS